VEIVVCCKAIPGAVTDVTIAPGGGALQYRSQLQALNECDEYGLEEAIALKKAYGGRITALTLGPITTQEIVYQALAKGADRAIRIDAPGQDPDLVSKALAAALRTLDYDLILTGTQSRDTLSGSTGIVVAHHLDIPFAFAVTAVEQDAPGSIKVRKELGGGRNADVRMSLPALLCVQLGIQPLTYVPPGRMLRARQQPLRSLSLNDLGLSTGQLPSPHRYHSVFPPARTGCVQFLEGPAPEIAATLVAKIKEVR
jgi:electron transfer flavoprotein beta subunit